MANKSSQEKIEGIKSIATYSDEDLIIFNDIRKLALLEVPLHTLVSDTNVVFYCAEGTLKLDVNDTSYTLTKRQVLICPPMAHLHNYSLSEDCFCHALSFSSNILHNALKNSINLWNKCLYVEKLNLLTVSEAVEDLWMKYHSLLTTKIKSEEKNVFNKTIIQSIIDAVILELFGFMVEKNSESLQRRFSMSTKQRSTIFKNFLDLLNNTPVKYHPVEFYASQLFVTPKYLAKLCRIESGKTAMTWIQERVIQDINFLMANPDLNIKEIAQLVGFDTVSLFGRFVRTHMGSSPKQLRAKL